MSVLRVHSAQRSVATPCSSTCAPDHAEYLAFRSTRLYPQPTVLAEDGSNRPAVLVPTKVPSDLSRTKAATISPALIVCSLINTERWLCQRFSPKPSDTSATDMSRPTNLRAIDAIARGLGKLVGRRS